MDTKVKAKTRRQLIGLLSVLALEFIFGVILTTLINFDPTKQSTVQTVFIVIHIIIGLGITIGALIQLVVSLKNRYLRGASTVGLISVLGAMTTGSIAARDSANTAVFLMALFFLIAFAAYGYGLVTMDKKQAV
jgi:hypothetical protein